jgi:hypothetical protein
MTCRTHSLTYNLSVCYYQHPSLKVCERETEDLEWSSPDSHRTYGFRVGSIKSVKMMGLAGILSQSIQNQRVKEMNSAGGFRWMFLFTNMIDYIPQIFAPVSTFVAFEARSRIQGSSSLSTIRNHFPRGHHFIGHACIDPLDCNPGDSRYHRLFRTHSEIPRCSFMGGPAEWFKKAQNWL